MADDTGITSGGGLDRRSLLKKAAVGGAVVWVAPTLLSGAAHAQGSSAPGTIIGGGFGGFGSVGLFSDDGGEVRAAVLAPISTQSPDKGGSVIFTVLGGKTYYLCGFDEIEGFYGCCTSPEVVATGATVSQTAPCSSDI